MEDLYTKVQALFDEYHAPAHDYKHVLRVSKYARQIAQAEGYDIHEAEVAGLLHDVGRTIKDLKGETHAHAGAPIAKELLRDYPRLSDEAKERIVQSIYVHSDPTTEGELNHIVQDADKLDGLGAVGIERTFISHWNRPDYIGDEIFPTQVDYYNIQTTHEAIILGTTWYDMLYTAKAKELGQPRYEFMMQFVEAMKKEINEAV